MPLAGYDGAAARAPGATVILGVRPEHVAIQPADAGGLPAVIDIDEPMGSDSLLWLTFAGRPLSVRDHRRPRLHATASRCSVAFDIIQGLALRPARPNSAC